MQREGSFCKKKKEVPQPAEREEPSKGLLGKRGGVFRIRHEKKNPKKIKHPSCAKLSGRMVGKRPYGGRTALW